MSVIFPKPMLEKKGQVRRKYDFDKNCQELEFLCLLLMSQYSQNQLTKRFQSRDITSGPSYPSQSYLDLPYINLNFLYKFFIVLTKSDNYF